MLVQPVGVLVGNGSTLLDVRVAQDLVSGLVGTGLDLGGLGVGGLVLSGHGFGRGCGFRVDMGCPEGAGGIGRGGLYRKFGYGMDERRGEAG